MRKLPIQQKERQFYREIAGKFGTVIRDDLVKTNKKKSISSLRTFTITDLSPKQKKCSEKKQEVNKSCIFSTSALRYKKQDIKMFKEKLKQNLQDSRIQKEMKTQELTNKVRWRRSLMIKNRQQKIEQVQSKNRDDRNIIRNIIDMRKEEQQRRKKQIKLEQSFECLERRLKSLKRVE